MRIRFSFFPKNTHLTRRQKIRYGILATGAAGVIVTGTLAGAGIKEEFELREKRRKLREASLDEQIAVLESQKDHLREQKWRIERRLEIFRERKKKRDAEAERERGKAKEGR